LLLSLCFFAATAFIAKASKTEPVPAREPLAQLPLHIGTWQGLDVPVDDRILSVLGVDDYVNRVYSSSGATVSLYMGFYQTQRQGSTVHSPMNCLPGAGWTVLNRSHFRISVAQESFAPAPVIDVNRVVIEKGMDRQMALYWYQAHGRVVASEYWGKIYTVVDAMRLNRTDAALVRIITPVAGVGPDAEQAAENLAADFTKSIFPLLSTHLPD
jgi:EpsI family protein